MKLYVVRDEHQPEEPLSQYHRLMWCPLSPSEDSESGDDDDDDLPSLAVTNGTLVHYQC